MFIVSSQQRFVDNSQPMHAIFYQTLECLPLPNSSIPANYYCAPELEIAGERITLMYISNY